MIDIRTADGKLIGRLELRMRAVWKKQGFAVFDDQGVAAAESHHSLSEITALHRLQIQVWKYDNGAVSHIFKAQKYDLKWLRHHPAFVPAEAET